MKKKIILNILSFAFLSLLALPAVSLAEKDTKLDLGLAEIASSTSLGDEEPIPIAMNVLNVVLGFLGLIAVVLVLVGGFKWMMAGGNEEKAGEARKLLGAGVIGLAIVLAAWGITKFVVERLAGATGASVK